MSTLRTVGLGLTAAALVSLASAHPAAAQAPPSAAASHNYTYSVAFNTPSPFLSLTSGGVHFQFSPAGPAPAAATITAGNVQYSNDWGVNTAGITTFGDAKGTFSLTPPITGLVVITGNTTPVNGFDVPVTKWGTSFGFDFTYADPPGTDPSNFTLSLQSPGQADFSLFNVQFSPSGAVTLLSSASGVGITPQGSAPSLAPPAVPEASTTVSLGLMLALGLGSVVLGARRKSAKLSR